jgi:hypothetical protein
MSKNSENSNFAEQYDSGNSALIIKYRTKLIEAFRLGEQIKEVYNIVPPRVYAKILDQNIVLNLGVN